MEEEPEVTYKPSRAANPGRKGSQMKIEALQERIAKAEEKISRKRNTISKKTALIAKKTAELDKASDGHDWYWIKCDIRNLSDDLERLSLEITETEKTVANYRAQLAGEIERQSILIHEVPEALKSFQAELITRWDEHDKARRDRIKADYREMEYREFCKKYRHVDTAIKDKTDEQIHEENVRDAEGIVLDLVNRVKDITGKITSWEGLRISAGNNGFAVLNGQVTGKEGIAYVESIGAGGYNIQRYHIRTLVKPI